MEWIELPCASGKEKKSISKISYYVWMDQGEQCDNGNVTLINESLG